MKTTYDFSNLTIGDMIIEAYERCGIAGAVLTGQQVESAKRSLNLLYSDWVNMGCNLWTVQQNMFSIVPGQAGYQLPYNTVDIAGNEMTVTNASRILGGVPYSSAGGNASNCFNGDLSSGCTQTSANGYISYDYGINNEYPITYVGIQTNINNNYTLIIEYSYDYVNWYRSLSIPLQAYVYGTISWFVLPSPISARGFRIRETGGATLDINEIYFEVPLPGSRMISRISREEYISITNKLNPGDTGSFMVDRTIQASQLTLFGSGGKPDTYMQAPTVYLYPCPDNTYSFIVYNMVQYIKDVNDLKNSDYVPQRWLEASIAGLAAKISLKFVTDKFELLQNQADKAYQVAAGEDKERVPLRIEPWSYFT